MDRRLGLPHYDNHSAWEISMIFLHTYFSTYIYFFHIWDNHWAWALKDGRNLLTITLNLHPLLWYVGAFKWTFVTFHYLVGINTITPQKSWLFLTVSFLSMFKYSSCRAKHTHLFWLGFHTRFGNRNTISSKFMFSVVFRFSNLTRTKIKSYWKSFNTTERRHFVRDQQTILKQFCNFYFSINQSKCHLCILHKFNNKKALVISWFLLWDSSDNFSMYIAILTQAIFHLKCTGVLSW